MLTVTRSQIHTSEVPWRRDGVALWTQFLISLLKRERERGKNVRKPSAFCLNEAAIRWNIKRWNDVTRAEKNVVSPPKRQPPHRLVL